jgi:hypothetical protein
MHPTLEVRWFFKGELPSTCYRWFVKAGVDDPEIRSDWYLYSAKNRGLGIKLRQGSLEIKQRLQNQGKCKLAKQVRGRLEQWVKWPFEISAESLSPAELGELWLEVNKKRWCQHYTMNAIGAIERTDSIEQVSGCTLELAELRVCNQDWYSLCFEAFGPPESVAQVLNAVVQQVSDAEGLPVLKARHSFGYPEWLYQVQQKTP